MRDEGRHRAETLGGRWQDCGQECGSIGCTHSAHRGLHTGHTQGHTEARTQGAYTQGHTHRGIHTGHTGAYTQGGTHRGIHTGAYTQRHTGHALGVAVGDLHNVDLALHGRLQVHVVRPNARGDGHLQLGGLGNALLHANNTGTRGMDGGTPAATGNGGCVSPSCVCAWAMSASNGKKGPRSVHNPPYQPPLL